MVQHLAKQERHAAAVVGDARGDVGDGREGAEVAQASLWGLGRTVMQEHPELECTLVDVERSAAGGTVADRTPRARMQPRWCASWARPTESERSRGARESATPRA